MEQRISIERMEQAVNLFGSFDENVRLIESEFKVTVSNREGELRVNGEVEDTMLATKALNALLTLSNRGEPITEQNVRYVISLVHAGQEDRISELTQDVICISSKGRPIKPKTIGQKKYIESVLKNTITIGVGPAGTGKTYLAVAAAVAAFRERKVNRIILTRPAVEAGERLGFLPGGIVDQHFNRRARLQRLLAAMEDAGENEGFGISEDTALEVSLSDRALRVHGSAYVMHLTRSGGTITIKKLTAAQHAVQ